MVEGMEAELTVQGGRMGCGELAWLRGWIDQNPQWSRKQIARELCRRWDWVDGRGRLKDFGARSLLLTLGGWGQVKRPTLRTQFRRVRPKGASLEPWEQPPTWTAALAEMAPVRREDPGRQSCGQAMGLLPGSRPLFGLSGIWSWMERWGGGIWRRIASRRQSRRSIFIMPESPCMRLLSRCLAPEPPQSKEGWRGRLHRRRHGKETPVVPGPAQRLESPGQPSAAHQELITREVNYFQEHEDHLHYSAMEKAGAPMGCGAVQSLGKQLQRRRRGGGQFWGRPGLTRLLHLTRLLQREKHCH